MGDLNFPEIVWTDTQNPIYPSGEGDTSVQINALLELADEFLLNQLITKPTRGENVLDLAFTNVTSDLVDCTIAKCDTMSDHNIIEMHFPQLEQVCDSSEQSEENKPPLSKLNFYKSDWPMMRSELSTIDWESELRDKTVSEQLNSMMEIVTQIAEKHTPIRGENSGSGKRKSVFFRKRRALWRRRRRLIERLQRSNSKDHYDSLTDNIAKLDTELKQWFEKEKIDEENKAISNITANSKYFFSYAKKKLKTGRNIHYSINYK